MNKALKSAFQSFLNVTVNGSTFPEILATAIDATLTESKDSAAAERHIEGYLALLGYVHERDVFVELSRAKLAKRLLCTTADIQLEQNVLGRIKYSLGNNLTEKLEGMLRDYDASRGIEAQFLTNRLANHLPCGFTCDMLTGAHWPSYKVDVLRPLESLRQCIAAFETFYHIWQPRRKLFWMHSLGSSTLSISFPKGLREITCSTYQAATLMFIDMHGKATPKLIAENLNLDLNAIVKPHVTFLLTRVPILNCIGYTGKIDDDSSLELNQTFHSQHHKLKLPRANTSTSREGVAEMTHVEAQRNVQMTASVVRIMKTHRSLATDELVNLTIQDLSKNFVPQRSAIKERIRNLVQREYLRYHPDDCAKVEYIA